MDAQEVNTRGALRRMLEQTRSKFFPLTGMLRSQASADEVRALFDRAVQGQTAGHTAATTTMSAVPASEAIEDTAHLDTAKQSESLMTVGLHTCGDLCSTALRLFAGSTPRRTVDAPLSTGKQVSDSQEDIKRSTIWGSNASGAEQHGIQATVVVGCCYNLLSERSSDSKTADQDTHQYGFPLSSVLLKRPSPFVLGPRAR